MQIRKVALKAFNWKIINKDEKTICENLWKTGALEQKCTENCNQSPWKTTAT